MAQLFYAHDTSGILAIVAGKNVDDMIISGVSDFVKRFLQPFNVG